MEFRVGKIIAKCPGCGGTQFETTADERSGPQMNHVCAGCGQTARYSQLITQIGREALRQRRERLAGEREQRLSRSPAR
jgi:RNase P subunit RPR2